jgi:TRAP-type C4-dicarboxylate transport system permease small subunit
VRVPGLNSPARFFYGRATGTGGSGADDSMDAFRRSYDRLLEVIAVAMIVGVTVIVVLGFTYRWMGASLVWYDEVASISLAWLTYFGSALAAMRGAHLGFPGLVNSFPASLRVAATLFASGVTIFFFVLMAWIGIRLLPIIAGITLVSIPEISQAAVMASLPLASALFVVAELLRLPGLLAEARRGPLVDREIKEALEAAGVETNNRRERRP